MAFQIGSFAAATTRTTRGRNNEESRRDAVHLAGGGRGMNVNETAMPLNRSFTTLHFAARLSLKLCKYGEMERLSGRMGTSFHPRKEGSRRRRWRDGSHFFESRGSWASPPSLPKQFGKRTKPRRTAGEYELHESAVAFYVCDTHHSLAAGPA